ncbi:MAG: hypothetical protein Fur0017_31910 [Anaerolineales bacterium]
MILVALLLLNLISGLLFSFTTAQFLGILTFLFTLAFSTYTIYTKHAGTEQARAKILKEVGVMVLTLIVVLFLGGIAAMLANAQVSMRWGEVAGVLSAIGASFGVGYLVRKGMMMFLQ